MKFKLPQVGEKRTIVKFAWFPKTIEINGDRMWIWLEKYIVRQKYVRFYGSAPRWTDLDYMPYSPLHKTIFETKKDDKK